PPSRLQVTVQGWQDQKCLEIHRVQTLQWVLHDALYQVWTGHIHWSRGASCRDCSALAYPNLKGYAPYRRWRVPPRLRRPAASAAYVSDAARSAFLRISGS